MPISIDRRAFVGTAAAAFLCGPLLAASRRLDIALINCRVWTGERGGRSDAVGIASGRIAALGADAVRTASGPGTQIIDLKGAFVMPAIIDCHTHFLRGSNFLQEPEFLG